MKAREETRILFLDTGRFLLGHFLLLQDKLKCSAELPDLFTITLNNEGPTSAHTLMMIMRNSKTNQHGYLEYRAVL